MKEQKNLQRLIESNLEKAELVLEIKSSIVDKMQRNAELLSNMRVDILGPLVDRIKAEHGLEEAEAFKNNISGLIAHAVDTLMDVKDKISTETLRLTGDITSGPDVSELGAESTVPAAPAAEIPAFDFNDDADLPPLDEPVPQDRAVKESAKPQRLGMMIESVSGRTGNKYFNNAAEMNKWMVENRSKIKRVVKVLK